MRLYVRMTLDEKRMGEAKCGLIFDLPETIEVELPDEALEFVVPEELGSDLSLKFLGIENVDELLGGVQGDDVMVVLVLHWMGGTLRMDSSRYTKFPFLSYFCISKLMFIEFESKFKRKKEVSSK